MGLCKIKAFYGDNAMLGKRLHFYNYLSVVVISLLKSNLRFKDSTLIQI